MNPHKKNIELTGSLIYPIEVGEAASCRIIDAGSTRSIQELAGYIRSL